MSRSDRALQLRDVAQQVTAPSGLLVDDLTITPVGSRRVVRVVVDRDLGGLDPADETSPVAPVSLDEVADVSRRLSLALDAAPATDLLGDGAYVLEVSSPGVERPLVAPRHFRRSVGRLVAVRTHDGELTTGRLTRVGPGALVLDVPTPVPGGTRQRSVPLGDVVEGRVQVEFARVPDEEGEEL